ncbi:MAG: type II secretion system F family protein [Candidatus Woesearchaeota archaeon]
MAKKNIKSAYGMLYKGKAVSTGKRTKGDKREKKVSSNMKTNAAGMNRKKTEITKKTQESKLDVSKVSRRESMGESLSNVAKNDEKSTKKAGFTWSLYRNLLGKLKESSKEKKEEQQKETFEKKAEKVVDNQEENTPSAKKSEDVVEKSKGSLLLNAINHVKSRFKISNKQKDGLNNAKKEERIEIAKVFRKQTEETRKKLTAPARKRRLVEHMEKAGLELEPAKVPKIILTVSGVITAIATLFVIIRLASHDDSLSHIALMILLLGTLGFFLIWVVIWLSFMIYIDIRMYQRKLMIEEVLPDFLQLTSANIRAGMSIDRALWFAVRPKFGVLAKEIEDVAKRTLSGEDLNKALIDFSKRYDSTILERSITLLIEGTESGGDVGELLNKIAINISELRAMKKEMSANVMTYAIFITFASIIAAPVLFALSEQLLLIVQKIATGVSSAGSMPRGGMISINISSDNIKPEDYRIFIYACLGVSSLFSGIIVTTIRKGDVKEGLHYLPIFILATMIIFFLASKIMGMLFGSIFS